MVSDTFGNGGALSRALLILSLLATANGCTDLRARLLCGKVVPGEFSRKQDNFFKEKGYYSTNFYQLKLDPPEECREGWRYEINTAEDKKSYRISSHRISTGETWVVDEKGILEEAAKAPGTGK